MLNVHPLLAGFVRTLLARTPLVVSDVHHPGKPIGGTWIVKLNNGASLSLYYGRGLGGCYWYARYVDENYNLSIRDSMDTLRQRILERSRI